MVTENVDFTKRNLAEAVVSDEQIEFVISNSLPNITNVLLVDQGSGGTVQDVDVVHNEQNITATWFGGKPDFSSFGEFFEVCFKYYEEENEFIAHTTHEPLAVQGVSIINLNSGIDVVFTEKVTHNNVLIEELNREINKYVGRRRTFLNMNGPLPMNNNDSSGFFQQIWTNATLNLDNNKTDLQEDLDDELNNARDLRI